MLAICKRVRSNNGIVEVLFTRLIDFGIESSQEEHVLINVVSPPQYYVEGKTYLISIQPAETLL